MSSLEVVVLTYNRAPLIAKTLQSIIGQQGVKIDRVSVYDNGSTDSTPQVVRQFDGVGYHRKNKNIGPIKAFEEIIKSSSSKWLVVMHDDDILLDGALEALVSLVLEKPEVSWVGGFVNFTSEPELNTNSYIDPHQFKVYNKESELAADFWMGMPLGFPTIMYNVAALKKYDFDNSPYGKYFDRFFLLKMLTFGPGIVLTCPLINYRIHEGQGSTNVATHNLQALLNYQGYLVKLMKSSLYTRVLYLRNLDDRVRGEICSLFGVSIEKISKGLGITRFELLLARTYIVFKRNFRWIRKFIYLPRR